MTPVEQAAQVVYDHRMIAWRYPDKIIYRCECCKWDGLGTHSAHLAQALANAGLLHDPDALNRAEGGAVTFGLMHPTWREPQCFFYATETDAWDAINRAYGADASHVVVRRVLTHINRADRVEAEADR